MVDRMDYTDNADGSPLRRRPQRATASIGICGFRTRRRSGPRSGIPGPPDSTGSNPRCSSPAAGPRCGTPPSASPALRTARRAAPGTAARLAVVRGRGRPGVDGEVPAHAIVAARFFARIAGAATAGNRKAVRPSVSGRARICARHAPGVDPADPFPLRSRLQAPGAQGRPGREAAAHSATARNPSGGPERSAASRTRTR